MDGQEDSVPGKLETRQGRLNFGVRFSESSPVLCAGSSSRRFKLLSTQFPRQSKIFRARMTLPRRLATNSVVMFWSYLSLADRDLFHPYDRMNNQSDYETCLPRELVRRHRLAHPAGGIHRHLRVGSRGRGSNSAANILLCLMPLLVNGALLINAVTPDWRKKSFWMLLALGCSFWMAGQIIWTYVEVHQHRHVPYLFNGDIVFFLHAIPMIAALTLQPHKHSKDTESAPRLCGFRADPLLVDVSLRVRRDSLAIRGDGRQTITSRLSASSPLLENLVFVVGAALLSRQATGAWRRTYAHLAGAGGHLRGAVPG